MMNQPSVVSELELCETNFFKLLFQTEGLECVHQVSEHCPDFTTVGVVRRHESARKGRDAEIQL